MEFEVIIKERFAYSLAKVLQYLEKEWGANVANAFMANVNMKIGLLKRHPHVGPLSQKVKNARSISVTKHNRLFYKISGNKIIITNLFDTRKKSYSQ